MRTALQIFAGIVLAIATLASILGFIALASDPRDAYAMDATTLAAAIGLALFAAILWMLTDVAEVLHATLAGVQSRPVERPREWLIADLGTFSSPSPYPNSGDTPRYCNACGKTLAEDGRSCSHCGNVVGIPPAPKSIAS